MITLSGARNLARALILAAEHAEAYYPEVTGILREQQMRDTAYMVGLPIEHQRAINRWIDARCTAAWKDQQR